MGKIDPESDRQRVTKLYAAMSDEELQKVGSEPQELTDSAFEALREEMNKRGLDWAGKDMPLPSQMVRSRLAEDLGNRPVVLRRYRDMPEAFVEKSVLEDAGIECFLQDDNVVRMDWLWSNAVGGIKLMVREKDKDEAGNLLRQAVPEKFTVEGVGEYQQEHCPQCGSREVSCDELRGPITGLGLLVGLPIPVRRRGWKCHGCGYAWDAVREEKPNKTE